MTATTLHYRTCPFCEATCGLEVAIEGDDVVSVRGDPDDVFSRGFLCPKSQGLKQLHDDPDRLTRPLVRRDGELREASWEEAFAAVDAGLSRVLAEGGRDAVAVYLGNPSAHSLGPMIYGQAFLKALGSKNIYSASSVDQMPKHLSAGLMFGGALTIPVPDIDRTDHLLILGANPLVSNGSLLTAPDMRGRLRAIRDRGGKIVVVDPRRTRTAREASEHHFIRPGTDALLLFAIANTLLAEGLADPGPIAEHANDAGRLEELAAPFTAEAVAAVCGIEAAEIRRIARELAAAERAAVYARVGTTTQRFGTLASWLVDVLNYLTGNLDHEGGAMFPHAAVGQRNSAGEGPVGKGMRVGRWSEPGRRATRGDRRASGRRSGRGDRHPWRGPGPRPGHDRRKPADLDPRRGSARARGRIARVHGLRRHLRQRDDPACRRRAARARATRQGPLRLRPLPARGPQRRQLLARRSCPAPTISPTSGRSCCGWRRSSPARAPTPISKPGTTSSSRRSPAARWRCPARGSRVAPPEELIAELGERRGPERVLDFMLRSGPFGDGFGADPEGLTLAKLEAAPHGIDLGAMRPRLPEALRTPSGKIELAPAEIVADIPRLEAELAATNGHMVLIGRRQLRSNNSWMHNLPALVKGPDRCTAQIHPDDAARLGLAEGGHARLSSSVGELVAPIEITDEIMPGVVSIPHGWGHDAAGIRTAVAAAHPGVNSNLLAPAEVDVPSGNAVLNGIPVEVTAADREPASVS